MSIIDAADRFAKKPMPPSTDPEDSRWTPDELRAMFAPSVKGLPFTSEKKGAYGWPEVMWADVPTNSYLADMKRGERFAAMTIEAMCADQAVDRPLEVRIHCRGCHQAQSEGRKGLTNTAGRRLWLPSRPRGVHREPMPFRAAGRLTSSPRRGVGHACPATMLGCLCGQISMRRPTTKPRNRGRERGFLLGSRRDLSFAPDHAKIVGAGIATPPPVWVFTPTEAPPNSGALYSAGLFVVTRAAEHLAGGGVHVMQLTAGDTLHRGIGRIVGRIVDGPALDAEVLVRAAEKKGCHPH
jgi:hypothetical protein